MVLTAQSDDALDVDIALDDTLLDFLGSATPGTAGWLVDDELNALLLAWRGEVEEFSIPVLVDTPTAIDTIKGEAA